jgi:hypothetical protein
MGRAGLSAASAAAWWRVLALAAVLVLAQAIGLAHQIAHAPGPQPAHDSALFGDHEAGGEQCCLLDSLLADPLPAAADAPVARAAPVAAPDGPRAARRARPALPPFGARAPPR